MKTLRVVLLRHGIAVDRADWGDASDLARPLTKKGAHRTRRAAKGLRVLGIRPELVLSSPAVRALQTAKLAARALRVPHRQLHEEGSLLPDAPPDDLLAALSALEVREVLCVGHAPHLDLVLAALLGLKAGQPALALRKSGAAVVDWDGQVGGGALVALLAPGALRNAARAKRH